MDLTTKSPVPVEETDHTTEYEIAADSLASTAEKSIAFAEDLLDGWENDGEIIDTIQSQLAGGGAPLGDLMVTLMEEFNDGTCQADEEDAVAAQIAAEHECKVADNMARVIFLGSPTPPTSYSIIGFDKDNTPLAISNDGGHVIMAMGGQGYGKTVASMLKIEAAIQHLIGISSVARHRTGAFSFFVDPDGDKLPQALAGINPNGNAAQLDFLLERLGARGTPLPRLNLVAPTWTMDFFQEHLHRHVGERLRLLPLKVGLPQLGQAGLEALMGADDDAQYVQLMLQVAQDLGDRLTMSHWHEIIDASMEMNATSRARAHRRLRLLDRITAPGAEVWDLGGPDELTVFCLGGRWIGWREALPVIMALLHCLLQRSPKHGPFQRIFQVDEVNHFDGLPQMFQQFLMVARLIRHLGSTLWISGQDFKKMPSELLALSTIFMMFRVLSREMYENVRARRTGFDGWSYSDIEKLNSGEAITTVSESPDPRWRAEGQWMFFRPMCCQHGGGTKAER